MSLPHIPVLRQGQPYESLDRVELKSVRTGEPVRTEINDREIQAVSDYVAGLR